MTTLSVRMMFVTALAVAVPSIDTPLLAQNPITAARDAFRKAQEEAKRKAQEEAQRRSGQAPAPGQPPAAQTPASPGGAPAAAPGGATGGAATPAGTPETTAALANAAAFVDVGGLKLGMPLQDVEAAIRALNPALKSQPPNVTVVWPYDKNNPTQPAPANAPQSVQDVTYQVQSPRGASEIVRLTFALYPNPAVVTNIERQVHYEQGKGPTLETVVQSLRTKYGSESAVINENKSAVGRSIGLRWLYESGNQPLQGNLARQMRSCYGGGDPSTACGSIIALDATVTADGNGVVTHLSVQTSSNPLTRSAAGATDAYLRRVDEERAKRLRDESSTRTAPKL